MKKGGKQVTKKRPFLTVCNCAKNKSDEKKCLGDEKMFNLGAQSAGWMVILRIDCCYLTFWFWALVMGEGDFASSTKMLR